VSALALLAAPSCPPEVREAAIEAGRDGEPVTHQRAKAMIERAKPKQRCVPDHDQDEPADDVPVIDAEPGAAEKFEGRLRAWLPVQIENIDGLTATLIRAVMLKLADETTTLG
jgi:hypothetical protein